MQAKISHYEESLRLKQMILIKRKPLIRGVHFNRNLALFYFVALAGFFTAPFGFDLAGDVFVKRSI